MRHRVAEKICPSRKDWVEARDLFESPAWFDLFAARALAEAERPIFLEIQGKPDAATSDGVIPLIASKHPDAPYPRLLRSMVNYYSCSYGPIRSSSLDEEVAIKRAADELVSFASGFDMVQLNPIDEASPFLAASRHAFIRARWLTETYTCFGNWYAPTDGLSYSDYLSACKSSFPGTCEKRRQQFLKRKNVRLEIQSDESHIDAAIDAYTKVYRASWKTPEPFVDFIPSLIRLAASNGWLRLGLAFVGSEPAAAQLWFVVNRRALIYKIAYDDRFSKLSVGSVLSSHMFANALDVDHVAEIDYLSGDDEYKAKWMTRRREKHGLMAFNPLTPRGVLMAIRHFGGKIAKRIVRFRALASATI